MNQINADAYGVASLSIVAALVSKLIEADIMTKDEVLELYSTVVKEKNAKAKLHGSAIEDQAAILVEVMRAEVEVRY